MATKWNMKGFIKRNEARYGWREAICPNTNEKRRIVTCTRQEDKLIDGEIQHISEISDICYDSDKCNNSDCEFFIKM